MVNAGGGQNLGLGGDYPSGGPVVFVLLVPVAMVALGALTLGFIRVTEVLGDWSIVVAGTVVVGVGVELLFDVSGILGRNGSPGLVVRVPLAIGLFVATLFAGIVFFLALPRFVSAITGSNGGQSLVGVFLSVLAVPIPIGVILFGAVRSISLVRE